MKHNISRIHSGWFFRENINFEKKWAHRNLLVEKGIKNMHPLSPSVIQSLPIEIGKFDVCKLENGKFTECKFEKSSMECKFEKI